MEAEFHRWLREHVPVHPRSPLGLADDAAVLSWAGRPELVVTTDLLSDGIDFRLSDQGLDPRRVGRKALAVNLSDLAAMAARPLAAAIAIALPRDLTSGAALELAIALYEGLLPLAAEFNVAVAGGDTNRHDGPLVISVTALGQTTDRGPLTRSGGQPGDKLLVTGSLGGSSVGHHFDFTPRVREALWLHERYELHASIDISDGLALDLARLAAESGCGALLLTERLPISDAARTFPDPLAHALGDGEDFELLLAAPHAVAEAVVRDHAIGCPLAVIGELTAASGLWQQMADGKRIPLAPTGWQH
jgi:thiamine-monophosphate kinase